MEKKYQKRRSIRLKGYDYTCPGGYFVTICSYERKPLFGKIINGITIPNYIGEIVQYEWFMIQYHRTNVFLHEDEFVLMPNHIHAIIWIYEHENNQSIKVPPTTKFHSRSLGAIIGQFKSKTSRLVNELKNTPGETIWQRNYFDHVIRNQKDLAAIRKYILNNPLLADKE
jgi:REP element-mobilizing transposase RayT